MENYPNILLHFIYGVKSALPRSRSVEKICSPLRTLETSIFPRPQDLILSRYLVISFLIKNRERCQHNMRWRDAVTRKRDVLPLQIHEFSLNQGAKLLWAGLRNLDGSYNLMKGHCGIY